MPPRLARAIQRLRNIANIDGKDMPLLVHLGDLCAVILPIKSHAIFAIGTTRKNAKPQHRCNTP